MAISLYDVSVTNYLQVLTAMEGILEKGSTYCQENDISLDDIVGTQLIEDMLPFRFQGISVVHHSLGSIKGVLSGEFLPPDGYGEPDYVGIQKLVTDARQELEGISRESVDAREGQPVAFKIGGRELPFTAENFVFSFSLPNLFFHATTAYDILRMKGAPLGKRDFLGQLRLSM